MTKNEKLIIICNALFMLCSGMSAVFMNVFLYTYTGSLIVMAIYTCVRIAVSPFSFSLAGKLALKTNYGMTLSLGLLFHVAELLFVLTCNRYFGTHTELVYFVAVLYGFGDGFYYLSVNTLNQLVTTPASRNTFLGISGILGNVMNVVSPLLATFIIDCSIDDMSGYLNIFKIVVFIFVFIAILGWMVKEKGNMQSFSVLKSLRFNKDKQWRYICTTYFIYGFRDSLVLTLAGLLVYNATNGSGSLYGKLLAVFACLSILAYTIVSKTMLRSNRMLFYTFGAIFVSTSTIVLVVFPNLYGALYYGIVNAIASPFYCQPFNMITMNAMSDYERSENLVGKVIAREIYLSISRCLGMLFIVFCYYVLPESMYLYVSCILLSLFPIVLVVYSNHYHKERDRLKRAHL